MKQSYSNRQLVDWFNQVDAAYRADLREINELNFTRFEAKLERRLGEQSRWLIAAWAVLLAGVIGLFLKA